MLQSDIRKFYFRRQHMNSVTVIGNLGRDPESIALPSGTQVVNFSLAVNDVYKNAEGEKVEKTNWIQVKAFGRLAETVAAHLQKGSRVGIHGRLNYEEWETDGQKRNALKVIADRIDFLSWRTVQDDSAEQAF